MSTTISRGLFISFRYIVPSDFWFRTQGVPALSKAVTKRMKKMYSGLRGLASITTDTWTSMRGYAFQSLTIRGV